MLAGWVKDALFAILDECGRQGCESDDVPYYIVKLATDQLAVTHKELKEKWDRFPALMRGRAAA